MGLLIEADKYASRICLIFAFLEICALSLLMVDTDLSIMVAGYLFFGGGLSAVVLRKIHIFKSRQIP